MLLPPLKYHRPRSLAELSAISRELAAGNRKSRYLAGGTDLIPNLKHAPLAQPEPLDLISLNAIDTLSAIRKDSDALHIGSCVRLGTIAADPLVKELFPDLASTAAVVATPQIRNMATLGGNIMVDTRCRYFNQPCHIQDSAGVCFKAGGNRCHVFPMTKQTDPLICRARFVSDTVPVLMLLGAKVIASNGTTERVIALTDLYREEGLRHHRLESGEIIANVQIPLNQPPRVAYEKLRIRNAIDFPSLGMAVAFAGRHLRMAVTGVGVTPTLYELDVGERLDFVRDSAAMADMIRKVAKPLEQDFFPTGYRRQMIPVMVQRVMRKLIQAT